jgi:hypothetical protein
MPIAIVIHQSRNALKNFDPAVEKPCTGPQLFALKLVMLELITN